MKRTQRRLLIAAVLVLAGAGAAAVVLTRGELPWKRATPAAGPADEICPEHQIAERDCPWCDPSLIERKGQCGGHGVPEALCTRCLPALIPGFKAEGDWCEEHGLPESQCALCNPEAAGGDEEDAALDPPRPAAIELVRAPERLRRSRAPSVTCATETLRVQLASPAIAREVGLEVERVVWRELARQLECNVELAYDGGRYARLAARAPGVVHAIERDLGQACAAGDVLAVVDSAELGAAKAELLQARALVGLWEKNVEREEGLLARGAGTEREALEAGTRLAESRIARARAAQRLQSLGLSEEQVARVAADGDGSSLLPLTAPFAGVVVERDAVLGEVVDTRQPLFALADTSRMWAVLDVRADDVAEVQVGQAVVLELDGLPGRRQGGRVEWVATRVDARTRTLAARAVVPNPDGLLRAGMFGKALVAVRERAPALVVPKSAVQWEGCCNVVFVRRSDVLYEPRKVLLGHESGRHYVVDDGLLEGEEVVTTASFLLKTEIMKESIGAGCCEVSPGGE